MSTGKYKALEKLVNTTHLPVLVEQKHVQQQQHTDLVEKFEPLTLTQRFTQTFLVVNYINDGKPSIFDMFTMVGAVEFEIQLLFRYSRRNWFK